MIDVAYAQGAGGAGGAGGGFSMLVPLLLMFGVFYFLLIRPQQKKQRRHQDMLKGLKVGDRVMTSGGANRITWPWVSLARMPSFISRSQ